MFKSDSVRTATTPSRISRARLERSSLTAFYEVILPP
jgi:hypothetical protein